MEGCSSTRPYTAYRRVQTRVVEPAYTANKYSQTRPWRIETFRREGAITLRVLGITRQLSAHRHWLRSRAKTRLLSKQTHEVRKEQTVSPTPHETLNATVGATPSRYRSDSLGHIEGAMVSEGASACCKTDGGFQPAFSPVEYQASYLVIEVIDVIYLRPDPPARE